MPDSKAKTPKRGIIATLLEGQAKGALQALIEEMFQDLYRERLKIYKLNFVRGIFFGLGSALGGTIVLALVIWLLSLFVEFPVIGDYVQNAQDSIQSAE